MADEGERFQGHKLVPLWARGKVRASGVVPLLIAALVPVGTGRDEFCIPIIDTRLREKRPQVSKSPSSSRRYFKEEARLLCSMHVFGANSWSLSSHDSGYLVACQDPMGLSTILPGPQPGTSVLCSTSGWYHHVGKHLMAQESDSL
ncbi:hypothetical protein B0T10DRAFT_547139 [Thelonectria olida]|uniref:Uncharacterized protein n=1 Tax=Thelonectria olida TaxID=1576542 RepID=A0A9P8WA51_9HYPO|nr:hypothetical protein B0T10DRAFT_547139 [Thelonectria olida]